MESTSAWCTHKGAWVCSATIVSCLQVRLWSGQPVPQWRKRAARPCGRAALKTVEGPPAPPPLTVRNRMFYQKIEKTNCASLPPHAGLGDVPKGVLPGLGGGAKPFFSVVLCWQNDKFCECLLATPSFQCIGGGSVPPPMPCRTLGWAARRKAHRLALAEALNLFSLSYCVGKTLKCVNVCLQRPVFNASGAAV